jgi:hypothetical protein
MYGSTEPELRAEREGEEEVG